MSDQTKTILKTTFGYDEFRPLQAEIIEQVLHKKDTLGVMPTGGGKSLCYQIPAMIFKGLTLVVSPLISLMKDQVEQLTELGVEAVFLNSSLSPEEYRHTVQKIQRGQVKLLYLAPETLLKPNTLSLLAPHRVDCLAIDEAHCISEWGHDFRPEYRQLVHVRTHFPAAVCIALTATATPRVRKDIKDTLRFEAAGEIIASFNRENLFIQIVPKSDPLSQTIEFLGLFPNQSGIIYCFSRRQVDELYGILERRGFSVKPYHAGLSETERRQNQELFIRDDVQIMVATIAFGMGINKPNVRFVVHYDLPKNIESYYQEIGRAGRDGLRAHCLLLFGYADIQKIRYFISQKDGLEQRIAGIHLSALLGLAETDACRRKPLLAHFGETCPAETCDMCDNCLAGAKPRVDITRPAQMFCSCIKRTGEMFGVNHIVNVLRGSQAQKVLKFNHQNLSTYGIGQEYSKKQWFVLSRQFLLKGLITQDMKLGSLKLTQKGYQVLQGKKTVRGTLEDEPGGYTPKKEAEYEYDHELFETLRKKRKELADAEDVPPYIIFPDKTLLEMATFFPQSEENLLHIHGVGAAKSEKYGGIFLDMISKYCRTHNIQERSKSNRKPLERTPNPTHKQRHLVIGEAYNTGRSVAELMAEFSIKQATVLNHLYKYLQEGRTLRSDGLLPLSTLPPDQQTRVLNTFDRLGAAYLKPIFEALNGEIDYPDLRILHLYYLSRSRSHQPDPTPSPNRDNPPDSSSKPWTGKL